MNVLHINVNYLATTLHQLMNRTIEQRGIKNTIIVPCFDKETKIIIPDKNVNILKCFNFNDRFLYWYKQKKIQRAINNRVDINLYSLVHAHTVFTDGGIAMWLKKKYGIPYIIAVRNTDINVFFKYMFFLRNHGVKILKNSERIIFLSPISKEQLYTKYLTSNNYYLLNMKTVIIPNGIDEFWLKNTPRKPRSNNDGVINIIYAGAINKNKNILSTIEACEILIKKGYSIIYTVVGKIEDYSVLDKIKQFNFAKYIQAQPKEELLKLYRCNDIFVMPSYNETFGLVYAEALSQGLPVIYSKGQGFDGQFNDGLVGCSVEANDVSKIADAILSLFIRRYRMFESCIKASKKFDWEIISQKYVELYNEVVKE